MGFMDKVRSQATQLAEKAQEGLQTGKGKIDELQERKRAGALLQELGSLVYRQQTGRDTPATPSEIERLVTELKKIEDDDVPFLLNVPPPGNGAAEPGDQGPASY